MSHKCSKCSDEFDTERGLHIHQSQMHNSEKTQDSLEKNKTDDKDSNSETEDQMTKKVRFEPDSLILSIQEVAAIFFILGIGIGFVAGAFAPLEKNLNVNTENTGEQGQQNGDSPELPIEEDTVTVSNINTEGEPTLGDQNAPVTLVMYEDFQCPFCQRFENNAFQQIESNYVESGKVKVIWKDFPLPQLDHDWAEPAAAGMECVYRQDESAFWEIKDKVFDNQRTLTKETAQPEIIKWAVQEGVSESSIRTCIESGNPMEEVNQDKNDGSNLDVTLNGKRFVGGTPSFVLYGDEQGTALSGALPYQAFQQVIDKEMQDSQ